MRGDLTHMWGSEFFDDTGNSDLRCGPMSSLHQWWTRKYQLGFLSRVSSWAGNIRQQGNIKGFISCQETTKGKYQTLRTGIQRPQRRALDHKADPFRGIHAYTHNVYTGVYTYIQAHFKAPLRRATFMGFPCFWPKVLIHSVCLLLKQTN